MSHRRRRIGRAIRRLRLREGDVLMVEDPQDAQRFLAAGQAMGQAGLRVPIVPILIVPAVSGIRKQPRRRP